MSDFDIALCLSCAVVLIAFFVGATWGIRMTLREFEKAMQEKLAELD